MEQSVRAFPPIDLYDLLFVLFLGLKLGGVIDWSWWWVAAPMIWSLVISAAIRRIRERAVG